MAPKCEHWETASESPPRDGRRRLPGSQRRVAPGRCPRRGSNGHPAGPQLHSPRPRRRQPTLPPPRPHHPSDTRAAVSQHVGRCCTPGGLLRSDTDQASQAQGGSRCVRSVRTQTVDVEAAATVVPPEAREKGLLEASPDTLCATGSFASSHSPPPFPTDFRVWLGFFPSLPRPYPHARGRPAGLPLQTLPPVSFAARGQGSLSLPGGDGRASARLAVAEEAERRLLRLRRRTRVERAGGQRWLRTAVPHRLNPGNPPSAVAGDKGAPAFAKGTRWRGESCTPSAPSAWGLELCFVLSAAGGWGGEAGALTLRSVPAWWKRGFCCVFFSLFLFRFWDTIK